MPSAAAVLGFDKSEHDILGGWSAEGSQRYTRTAKYKIAHMQTAVASTFNHSEPDQPAEFDDIDSLAGFLEEFGCSGGINSEVSEDLVSAIVRRSREVRLHLSLFLLIVDVIPGELALDNLDEEAEVRKNCRKRSSKLVTEVDPNYSVRITSKLVRRFAHSCRKGTIFLTLARRLFELCTAWDVATCCLELIIYLFHTQAYNFRLTMSMTLCASGVRRASESKADPGSSGTNTSSSSDE